MTLVVPGDDDEEVARIKQEVDATFQKPVVPGRQLAPKPSVSSPPIEVSRDTGEPPPQLTPATAIGQPATDDEAIKHEVDAAFAGDKQQRSTVLREAAKGQADKKGQAVELARKLGVPVEVVEQNVDEARARLRALQAESAMIGAPFTQEFMRNPNNAAVALDDVGSLSLFEHAWNKSRSLVAGSVDFPGRAVEGLGHAWTALGRALVYGPADILGVGSQVREFDRNLGNAFPVPEGLGMVAAGKLVRSIAESVRPPAEQRDLGDEVAEGLGQVASQIATAIATGGASSIITTLSMFGSGVQQQQDKLDELKQEPTPATDSALMIGGAITAITERWGLGNLLERIPAAIKNRIGRALAGATSEASQEFVENILQNLAAKAIYDPKQEVMEGVARATTVGGIVGAIVSAIVPGKRAVHFQKQMDEGRRILEESNLADKSPSVQADFVAKIWEANGFKEFYVPIKAIDELAQTKDDRDGFYRDLGITPEQLDTARLTNGDVAIPLRTYAEHIYATDDYQALKDHTRQAIGEMTKFEADEYAKHGVKEDLARLGLTQEQVKPGVEQPQSPPMEVSRDTSTPEKAAANRDVTVAENELGMQALFRTAAEAGVTPSEYTEYLTQLQRAQEVARDRMVKRYLDEQKRSTEADWQKQREIIQDQVDQSIRQEPVYAAMDAIGRERLNQAAVREALAEIYSDPDAAMKALPKVDGRTVYAPKSEGGIHPEVLAQQHGFANTKEMLLAMQKAGPIEKVVQERTDQLMQAKFGQLADERRRLAAAYDSLHNDRAADLIAWELDALRQAKKEGRTNPKLIRAFAREQMQDMKLGDINARQFMEQEKREAREAGRQVRKNDRMAAAQAKFRQLMNFQYASEALALSERIPKQRKELGKFLKNRGSHKNIGADRIDQIRELLSGVDLNNKDMTVADWNVLYSRAKQIEAQGRRERQIVMSGRKVEFETVKAEMLDSANKLEDTAAVKRSRTTTDEHGVYAVVAKAVSWAQAEFGKMEFMLQKLDGGDPTGTWHQAVFQPIADAQTRELDLRSGTIIPLVKSLESIPNAQKRARTQVNVPELGLNMRVSELWMLALNVGNQSNFDKVIEGSQLEAQRTGRQPWTHEGVMQALTTHLSEKEWAWVQKVWDAYANLYPEVERIYRDEHGQSPERIDPTPIRTPEGTTLKGGYFPMLYDSAKAMTFAKTSTLALFEGNQVRESVYSGMTKTRTGYAAPVLLDFGALPRALDQHIHFITHYDAVKDVRKILKDTSISNAVKNKLGPEQYKEMSDWTEAVATGNVDTTTRGLTTRMGEFFRRNTVAAIMGASYTTAVSQLFGYSTSVAVLGYSQDGTFSSKEGAKWMAVGVQKYATNPSAAIETVFKLSGEMRHRFGNADRDISEALREFKVAEGPVSRALAKQQRLTLQIASGVQMYGVDVPTWIGAYNQAQSWGYDRERSVQHADAMLRTSQASGHIKDLSAIQRQKGPMRLLTMFGSYLTLLYNLEAQTLGDARKAPLSSIARFAWLVAIPALLDSVMRMDLPGDDDDPAIWWPVRMLGYSLSAIPVAGRAVDSMLRGYDPTLSAIESLGRSIPNAVKATGKIFSDDDFELKDFRQISNALGGFFGVGGTTQFTRVLKAVEADDNADLYDYLIGYDEKRKRKGN